MVQTQEYRSPPQSPSPPPSGAGPPSSGTAVADENVLAGVAYILTWITGLVILLVSRKEQKKARWHAIQAIGFGIVWTLVGIVGSMFGASSFLFGFGGFGAFGAMSLIFTLLSLGFLALWIVLIVYGFTGKTLRLPVIADFADKNA